MLWCYDDSTHDVDEYQTSSQHSFLKGCPHQKLNVWRNTRCSNKTRILHGKITPFKGTTCAPALLQECCWCETLTALLESRLLGINEADIRESGNNNRKHMKTQPFFVLSKQLLHHIASPHLRLPQAAAPRAGTWELRRLHALGNSPSPGLPGLPGMLALMALALAPHETRYIEKSWWRGIMAEQCQLSV